jgi:hypothetical protein
MSPGLNPEAQSWMIARSASIAEKDSDGLPHYEATRLSGTYFLPLPAAEFV